MKKTNLYQILSAIVMMMLLVCIAAAQNIPVQYAVPIAASSVAQDTEWTVPIRQNGWLLGWEATGAGSAETVALKHMTTYTGTTVETNAIETAAARNAQHWYPTAYLPPQTYVTNDVILTTSPKAPIPLKEGDRLSFRLSATNAATTVILYTSLRD
jgi:hypothetical protein